VVSSLLTQAHKVGGIKCDVRPLWKEADEMKRTTILTFFASTLFLVVPFGSSIGNSPPLRAEQRKCPTVEVKGPSKSKAFRNISYRAEVKNFSGATPPVFKWSLVGGVLIQGQGSDVITVEPRAREIRATLMIENFPVGCDSNSYAVITRLTDIPRIHLPPLIRSIKALPASIIRPCSAGAKSDTCTPSGSEVQLSVDVAYPLDLDLLFTWYVTVGRLKGEGQTVIWDLSGVASGTYKVDVAAQYFQHIGTGSATVTITDCNDCKPVPSMDATKLSECPLPPRVTSHAHLRSTDIPR